MSKILHKKYKDFAEVKMDEEQDIFWVFYFLVC